jgi:light-regulated signal transduction histidine kinase (bacteriophytochrome)
MSVLTIVLGIIIVALGFTVYKLKKRNQSQSYYYDAKAKALELEVSTNTALLSLLHNIFESSLHGIIAFVSIRDDQDTIVDFKYEMVNEVAAQIVGQNVNDLTNQTMLNLLPGNKESGLFDSYVDVVQTGQPFSTVMHYSHDGMNNWFAISAVKNQDGFIVTFSDISVLKGNEQLLLRKQRELEEANSELEQFAYIASHDLQEPLRKIRAFGERLDVSYASVLDDKGKDYINRMRGASARMQKLIDDLLTFSRATKRETEMVSVNINDVLNVVKELLSEQIDDKQAIIVTDELPDIYANESQMIQLFQNVISNALKYAKDGVAPKIEIKLSQATLVINKESIEFWQIEIKDNGIGFDNANKRKIFEIFQRLHGRADYDGTGIGLAICLKIVTNNHGFMYAHSEPGKGSLFTIQLPKTAK